ncbi:DUF4834 family protein [Roseivirga sp. E12]|uniref:DUF4834 family protein n=1 Tax=Roseivirga sp. E12 TaxID=2819237 RepID=UPI001ABC92C7|nr:DUF4834 family protein [Roseivirga sp. E12]MBO3699466.1 DUF4834 family protein [Roseivirga sp. E12]
MGILLKFILFIVVIGWLFKGVSRFFLGNLYKQAQQQQYSGNRQRTQTAQPKDGNVSVEYAPKKKTEKSADNFKGGDYVDYEEVKD